MNFFLDIHSNQEYTGIMRTSIQVEIANQTGFTQGFVSKVLNRKIRRLPYDTAEKFSNIIGGTPELFIRGPVPEIQDIVKKWADQRNS